MLFTTGFLEAGYRRFIERKLREEFGFAGSPVRISVRVREKKKAGREQEVAVWLLFGMRCGWLGSWPYEWC